MMIIALIAGFFAGLIDSMAGGGGLISVPTLLALGLPPKIALGTNKLQSTFGSSTAMIHYARNGLINWKNVLPGIFFTFIGATLGTFLVQHIPNIWLARLIPFLLIIMAIYMFFNKDLGQLETRQKFSSALIFTSLGITLGFYDGFFGPGTGNFWTLGLVLLLGMDLKVATAHTKVVNFVSNIVALAIFLLHGAVNFRLGFSMALGQFIGASVGSRLVVKKGSALIRPLFISVVLILSGYLLYKQYIA